MIDGMLTSFSITVHDLPFQENYSMLQNQKTTEEASAKQAEKTFQSNKQFSQ
jgi:hypothetical protein